ncbi:MAG: hypothetical protein KKC80_08785 [Candidatus Margulisbacteria bacterium]|nr:hypothetical protein [Candidatus Margulisiibacteriota bacterium]
MGKLGNLSMTGQGKQKLAPVSMGNKSDISPLHVQGLEASQKKVVNANPKTSPQSPIAIKNATKLNDPLLKTKAPSVSQVAVAGATFQSPAKLPSFLK